MTEPKLPRVAITYCTQCKWMLRAAYFGQELLSTFGTTIGEIALIPATGGLFQVELTYMPPAATEGASGDGDQQTASGEGVQVKKVLLWDRKTEGGFPETKVLKQRVRNHLDPGKDLGHSDTLGTKKTEAEAAVAVSAPTPSAENAGAKADGEACEDCK